MRHHARRAATSSGSARTPAICLALSQRLSARWPVVRHACRLACYIFNLAQFGAFTPIQGPGLSDRNATPFFGIACLAVSCALMLAGCGGSSTSSAAQPKVYAPEDMPEICQDIDFNQAGTDIKEICGVQTRNYWPYKNIPEHRNLLAAQGRQDRPQGQGPGIAIAEYPAHRLPRGPGRQAPFRREAAAEFRQDQDGLLRILPRGLDDERLRIIKLDIPLDIGGGGSICYTVESRPNTAQRKAGFAGRLEPLECTDFMRLKSVSQSGSDGKGDKRREAQASRRAPGEINRWSGEKDSGP